MDMCIYIYPCVYVCMRKMRDSEKSMIRYHQLDSWTLTFFANTLLFLLNAKGLLL